jgi:hypothetical protein
MFAISSVSFQYPSAFQRIRNGLGLDTHGGLTMSTRVRYIDLFQHRTIAVIVYTARCDLAKLSYLRNAIACHACFSPLPVVVAFEFSCLSAHRC